MNPKSDVFRQVVVGLAIAGYLGLESWQSLTIRELERSKVETEAKWLILGELRQQIKDLSTEIRGVRDLQVEIRTIQRERSSSKSRTIEEE